MATDSTAAAPFFETTEQVVSLACMTCGTKTSALGSELTEPRSCPSCHAALGPLAVPLDVDARELAAVVISARVPVLVDFWAPWCPPCRVAGPIVNKVATDLRGKALVLKVDTDRQSALAAEFGVRAVPTFVVIRDRKVVKHHSGLAMPGTIKRWLSAE